LRPRVDIIPHGLRDPTMSQWINVMRQLGGGRVPTHYNDDFFFWLCWQVIAIDDYSYVGIDYRGDPYIPFHQILPTVILVRNVFIYFIFFFFKKDKTQICLCGIK
jgi:hypothetical protein